MFSLVIHVQLKVRLRCAGFLFKRAHAFDQATVLVSIERSGEYEYRDMHESGKLPHVLAFDTHNRVVGDDCRYLVSKGCTPLQCTAAAERKANQSDFVRTGSLISRRGSNGLDQICLSDGIDVAIRSKENILPIDKRDVVPDAGQSCAEISWACDTATNPLASRTTATSLRKRDTTFELFRSYQDDRIVMTVLRKGARLEIKSHAADSECLHARW